MLVLARPILLILVLLPACPSPRLDPDNGDDDDATADDDTTGADDDATGDDDTPADDDTTTGNCPIIAETSPANGATGVFSGLEISVTWNLAPSDSVTFSLTDEGSGSNVSGTTSMSANGRSFFFDPDSALDPSWPYSFSVDWGCGAAGPISFTTGSFGEEITDPTELIGRSWSVDFASGLWVEPPGIGSLLASQVEGLELVFSVLPQSDFSMSPGELHLAGSLTDAGGASQDLCERSLDFTFGDDGIYGTADDVPAAFWNPDVVAEIGTFDMATPTALLTLHEVVVTGTWSAELEATAGGQVVGILDTRPLAALLDVDGDEGALCELVVETVGVPCIQCGLPDPGPFCLQFQVTDLSSQEIPGTVIVVNTCDDIAQNPACSEEQIQDCVP